MVILIETAISKAIRLRMLHLYEEIDTAGTSIFFKKSERLILNGIMLGLHWAEQIASNSLAVPDFFARRLRARVIMEFRMIAQCYKTKSLMRP